LPKKQKTSLPPSLEQAKGLPVVSEKYRVLQTAGTGAGVTADKGERMCRLSPFDPPPSFGSPPLSLSGAPPIFFCYTTPQVIITTLSNLPQVASL